MAFDTNAIDDYVELKLGDEVVKIYEDYSIETSILQQPSAFAARLGWTKTTRELLRKFPPRTPYQLSIRRANTLDDDAQIVVQSGLIDSIEVSGDDATAVTFKGRGYLAGLFDAYIESEVAFSEKTYAELTKRALREVGLGDRADDLIYDFEDTRKAITGIQKRTQILPPRNSQDIQLDAATGKTRIVYNTIKAELGETWWNFLQRQYKLAGLFLWETPEGGFILSEPNADQEPIYRIVRERGALRNAVNVLRATFHNNHVGRHSSVIVYGRSGGGPKGRKKIRGEFVDEGMTNAGYQKPIVFHDEDARTAAEAEFVARRQNAEEARAGYALEYIVAGHRTPSLVGPSFAIWAPDTVAEVKDEEIGFNRNFYLEGVKWSRGPQTTTTLRLMRPQDLVFAEKQPGTRERDRKAKRKHKPRDV